MMMTMMMMMITGNGKRGSVPVKSVGDTSRAGND